MVSQLGFYVNVDLCVGCRSCEAACQVSWGSPPGIPWRKVGEVEGGDFPRVAQLFLSLACNHCEVPVCALSCPTKAYTKRDDGVVLVDPGRCIGCKMCTWACPYGAPQYDPQTRVVTKCHFCQPLIDAGGAPRCVTSCPYDALDWGPMDELLRRHPNAQRSAPHFPDPEMISPNILFELPVDMPVQTRRVDAIQRLADAGRR